MKSAALSLDPPQDDPFSLAASSGELLAWPRDVQAPPHAGTSVGQVSDYPATPAGLPSEPRLLQDPRRHRFLRKGDRQRAASNEGQLRWRGILPPPWTTRTLKKVVEVAAREKAHDSAVPETSPARLPTLSPTTGRPVPEEGRR